MTAMLNTRLNFIVGKVAKKGAMTKASPPREILRKYERLAYLPKNNPARSLRPPFLSLSSSLLFSVSLPRMLVAALTMLPLSPPMAPIIDDRPLTFDAAAFSSELELCLYWL